MRAIVLIGGVSALGYGIMAGTHPRSPHCVLPCYAGANVANSLPPLPTCLHVLTLRPITGVLLSPPISGVLASPSATTPTDQQFYDALSPDLKRKVDEARALKAGARDELARASQDKLNAIRVRHFRAAANLPTVRGYDRVLGADSSSASL